jgi:Phage gp6-like head-tail connector protein
LAITNGYATLADVKGALRITDTIDDALLEVAIESASRLIDGYCNRYFWQGSSGEVRYYPANDSYICWIDDAVTITSLDTCSNLYYLYDVHWNPSPDATGSKDYETLPVNKLANGSYSPFTAIRAVGHYLFPILGDNALVKVTGTFGWQSVPTAVKQATIIQASRIYKRLESPLGVAGISDIGIMRVGRGLDGDVQQLVEQYRLMRINA